MSNLRTLNKSERMRLLPKKLRDLQVHVPSFQSLVNFRRLGLCRLFRSVFTLFASCTSGFYGWLVGPAPTPCLAGGPSCTALFRVPRWHEDGDQPPLTWRTDAVLSRTPLVNRRSGLVKHFLYHRTMATAPVFASHLPTLLLSE